MHISEPESDITLINYIIKVYELKRGPLGLIGQYWLPYNIIWKLQHLTTENELHSSALYK